MASVIQNKRTSESKFVSIFADGSDGKPDIDISFKEPLLSRPSDHYMVGVDNLTVNLNHLSMMRQSDADNPDDFVFQLGRFSDTLAPFAGGEPPAVVFPAALQFRVLQNYQNIQQILLGLSEFFSGINQTIRAGLAGGAHSGGFNVVVDTTAATGNNTGDIGADAAAADKLVEHVSSYIGADGQLRIVGTRAFWSNYFIRITQAEYQYIFNGKKEDGFFENALDAEGANFDPGELNGAGTRFIFNQLAGNSAYHVASISAAVTEAHLAYRNARFSVRFGANFLSSIDRRIALEIGCSLPIVNNPMVDHGKEHPDFTIGRWLWNPRTRVNSMATGLNLELENIAPSIHEFQNSTDRVQFHGLMPQDKIQFLRVKMYCRIRTYNAGRDRYDMETVVMPMTVSDWWHCRLHFVSKD